MFKKKEIDMGGIFSLDKAGLNKKYEIVEIIKSPLAIARRMNELGFITGEKIIVIRKSLLGRTYLIEIGEFILSVRKTVAEIIMVR